MSNSPRADVFEFVSPRASVLCGVHHGPQAQERHVLRQFLRTVPRSDGVVRLRVLWPDGRVGAEVTRAALTAAIDRLFPRYRHLVQLQVEEGWPVKQVCARLKICSRTYERDRARTLNRLWRESVLREQGDDLDDADALLACRSCHP